MRTIGLLILSILPLNSYAAVVSTTFVGRVEADFDGVTQVGDSILESDSLVAQSSADNSTTQSNLNWGWDGSSLTANSVLQAQKAIAAKPGGDHVANSLLTFEFTLDSEMMLSLDGLWGFNNASSGGELLQIQLVGESGAVFEDSSTSNTGIGSDTFGFSGLLGPGSYTFTIRADLSETINNQGTTTAGWSLNNFQFTAVPEPGFGLTFLAVPLWLGRRRARPAMGRN
jgi:hypothetical protein